MLSNQPTTEANSILDYLDLDLALKRVKRNILRESFPNRMDAQVLQHFGDQVKDRAVKLLQDAALDWANGSAGLFEIPRADKLTRPITYLDVDVRLVYQALVDAVAVVAEPYIQKEFDERLLSNRIRSEASERMFREPSEAFSKFIEIQHEHADASAYSHCVKLDVSVYYERIYHHNLHQLLQRLKVPAPVCERLMTLLRKFSNGVSYGIPQGFWPSDYLGNIYLLSLDEFLKDRNFYAIRYVDDCRIFCNSEREARSVLKSCCGILRNLGLSPQPIKTSIVNVERLKPEVRPLYEQYLNLRTDYIKVLVRQSETDYFGDEVIIESEEWEEQEKEGPFTETDIKAFEQLWADVVDQEEKRVSVLRFALAGLSKGASPTAEEYVLNTLSEFPHLALVTSKYLASLGFKDSTADELLGFLESPDCIHEWQQMWILQYFCVEGASLGNNRVRLKGILEDMTRHPLVRAIAAEVLALHGTSSDGADIKRLFNSESHPRLRRALLSGFKLLPETERNHAISYLPPTDWNLKLVGQLSKMSST